MTEERTTPLAEREKRRAGRDGSLAALESALKSFEAYRWHTLPKSVEENAVIENFEQVRAVLEYLTRAAQELAAIGKLRRGYVVRVNRDDALTKEERAAEIAAVREKYASMEEAYRREAVALAAQVILAAELEEEKIKAAVEVRPQSVEEWQEASARDKFIREDCERFAKSAPGQIVRAYRLATATGDKIGAYLYARHGVRVLSPGEDGENGAPETLKKLRAAIAEANPAREGATDAAQAARGAGVRHGVIFQSLANPVRTSRLAARFGIAEDEGLDVEN